MEITLFNQYCRAQKLKAEMKCSQPSEWISSLKKLDAQNKTGTLAGDMLGDNDDRLKFVADKGRVGASTLTKGVLSQLLAWCKEHHIKYDQSTNIFSE